MKKTTAKTKKPVKKAKFIVDYTNIEYPEDLQYEIIAAKSRAGIAIDEQEVKTLVMYGAKLSIDYINDIIADYNASTTFINDDKLAKKMLKLLKKSTEKKTPWYKKIWPFRKKK